VILLDWLKDTGNRFGERPGYKEVEILLSVQITEGGDYLSHQIYAPGERKESIPFRARTNAGLPTLVDDFRYTFGVPAPFEESDTGREEQFVSLLERAPTAAAQAVSRFISSSKSGRPLFMPTNGPLTDDQKQTVVQMAAARRWGPKKDYASLLDKFQPRQFLGKKSFPEAYLLGTAMSLEEARNSYAGSKDPVWVHASCIDYVLIEVEGHPKWWENPEVLRPYQERRVQQDGETKGRCSICLEKDVPLTTLFFESASEQLISFNQDSSTAYGRKRGLTAPTCIVCAGEMDAGFAVLTKNRHLQQGWMDFTYRAMWWDPEHLETNLWQQLELALAGGDPQFPRQSCFFLTWKNMKRLGLRRHISVDGDQLAERIRNWQRAGMPQIGGLWQVARLLGLPEENGGSQKGFRGGVHERDAFRATEDLLFHFLEGVPFSPFLLAQAEKIEGSATCSRVNGYFHGFYNMQLDKSTFTERQLGAYSLGAALRLIEIHAKKNNASPQELRTNVQARITKKPTEDWYVTLLNVAERVGKDRRHPGAPPWISEKLEEAMNHGAFGPTAFTPQEVRAFRAGYLQGFYKPKDETLALQEMRKEGDTHENQ
jgi:hypothetical protein